MTDRTEPKAARDAVQSSIEEVLVGNEEVVERLMIALLSEGHVLLEGVPGVAKTTIARLLGRATGLESARIQMTPDTLPADITGSTVYREGTGEFELRRGPIFANLVIADEINRATPKTQSALLEAMQEQQVTIDGSAMELPQPFMVVATQNPIEMEGTFELPEAQRDRFMMKLDVGLPDRETELQLFERFDGKPNLGPEAVQPVLSAGQIEVLRTMTMSVHVAPEVTEYLLDIVEATREHSAVKYGVSPRAGLALQRATKARAALRGRPYVLPDDCKALAEPVLAHRLVLDTEAALSEVEPATVIDEVLAATESPSAAAVAQGSDSDASGQEFGAFDGEPAPSGGT